MSSRNPWGSPFPCCFWLWNMKRFQTNVIQIVAKCFNLPCRNVWFGAAGTQYKHVMCRVCACVYYILTAFVAFCMFWWFGLAGVGGCGALLMVQVRWGHCFPSRTCQVQWSLMLLFCSQSWRPEDNCLAVRSRPCTELLVQVLISLNITKSPGKIQQYSCIHVSLGAFIRLGYCIRCRKADYFVLRLFSRGNSGGLRM